MFSAVSAFFVVVFVPLFCDFLSIIFLGGSFRGILARIVCFRGPFLGHVRCYAFPLRILFRAGFWYLFCAGFGCIFVLDFLCMFGARFCVMFDDLFQRM